MLGCKNNGYYVYGDSLTAGADSWANRINQFGMNNPELGVPHLQIQARPGMRLELFELPTWIRPYQDIDAVLIFLGGNDVRHKFPPEEFGAKLAAIIKQANAQGLDVVCIQIPDLPLWPAFSPTAWQSQVEAHCDNLITEPLDQTDTLDGVHPGPEGQKDFAWRVLKHL